MSKNKDYLLNKHKNNKLPSGENYTDSIFDQYTLNWNTNSNTNLNPDN